MELSQRPGYEKLYWNDRNGRFLEIAFSAGVQGSAGAITRSNAAADFDNDGWQDLVVANERGNLRLYRNRGDYTFDEVDMGPIAEAAGGVVVAADVDGDGWVDLYTPTRDREWLWLNDDGTNHWLKVKTRGKRATHYGVGARVEVYAGDLHQFRVITAGDGMTSQNHDLTAHFGLGTAARVDSLVVRWPHGAVDRIFDLEVDRTVTVVEGRGVNQPPSAFTLEQPADAAAVATSDETITFIWEAPTDAESDALTYTLYLTGPDFEHTVAGLTEPRLALDAAVLPPGRPLIWTIAATDDHSVRSSVDRFRFSRSTVTAVDGAVPVAPLQVWNYPNPFHATTTFGFTLLQAAHVEATIYDVTGRAVRSLVEGRLPGGEHGYVWDGLDDSARAVASGVYIARITAGPSAHSRVVVRR